MQKPLTCVEICAGAGGQALGLAMAGFVHVALVEYEVDYCNTLKQNRPEWNVICADVRDFDGIFACFQFFCKGNIIFADQGI